MLVLQGVLHVLKRLTMRVHIWSIVQLGVALWNVQATSLALVLPHGLPEFPLEPGMLVNHVMCFLYQGPV